MKGSMFVITVANSQTSTKGLSLKHYSRTDIHRFTGLDRIENTSAQVARTLSHNYSIWNYFLLLTLLSLSLMTVIKLWL